MLTLFKKVKKEEDHPAFQVGAQVGKRLSELTVQTANYLNNGQHRIGFRARNALIISTLILLFLLFVLQLSNVFN